jgi:tetratricopeptide (TPR) repeat protein
VTLLEDLCKKGKLFFENGEFLEAIECYEQALLLNPNDPDLWNSKGMILRTMGRYQEAIECFNRSLEIDPRDKNAS